VRHGRKGAVGWSEASKMAATEARGILMWCCLPGSWEDQTARRRFTPEKIGFFFVCLLDREGGIFEVREKGPVAYAYQLLAQLDGGVLVAGLPALGAAAVHADAMEPGTPLAAADAVQPHLRGRRDPGRSASASAALLCHSRVHCHHARRVLV
jgi:hypothetical protein